jgi:DNA-binding response OmpR family regulator
MQTSQGALVRNQHELVKIGDLEIHPHEGLVLASGRALVLSVREFDLLLALASHAGRVVSREELYQLAWGRTLRAARPPLHPHARRLRLSAGSWTVAAPPSHPFHTATTDR